MFAVIRIRGSVNVANEIEDTLKMLRLNRVNHCVVIPDNPNYMGMLQKARSYITWGEITQDTLERLVTKRGRLSKDERVPGKDAKGIARKILRNNTLKAPEGEKEWIKPVFRLSPPSKGYRSVRRDFPRGDLGNREEKINELIKRMI